MVEFTVVMTHGDTVHREHHVGIGIENLAEGWGRSLMSCVICVGRS